MDPKGFYVERFKAHFIDEKDEARRLMQGCLRVDTYSITPTASHLQRQTYSVRPTASDLCADLCADLQLDC